MLTLVQTTLQEQGEYGNEDKYRNEITLLWCVCRYSSETRDAVFSVGLQGIREEDVETVKELIWTTLNKVAELVLLLLFLFILFLHVYPVRDYTTSRKPVSLPEQVKLPHRQKFWKSFSPS